jgi:hypothetical protein
LLGANCIQADEVKSLKGELKEAILEKRALVRESAEDTKEKVKEAVKKGW